MDEVFPKISLATVYNTLNALVDAGLVKPVKIPNTGKVVYDAVVESMRQFQEDPPPDEERLAEKRAQALQSQARRYPGDWVWDFVEGDGETFEYGYDFHECGTHKLFHAHGADEFLPFFCYLDFVTFRTRGWSSRVS